MSNTLSTAELREAIDRVPRFALAHLPTPLEPLRNLSKELGGPTIWIKRDDCTGLAFGGNKTRHNEFLLGAALDEGADYFVWGAGVQSNNCRQTVAACVKAGIPIHIVLSRAHLDGPVETQGNLLLDQLMGASIEFVDAPVGPELDVIIADRAEQLRQKGHHPFFWNRNPVVQIAAISYVECAVEIAEQCQHERIDPAAIYVSSCGSTGSGLALGAAALGMNCPVKNIAPLTWPWDTANGHGRSRLRCCRAVAVFLTALRPQTSTFPRATSLRDTELRARTAWKPCSLSQGRSRSFWIRFTQAKPWPACLTTSAAEIFRSDDDVVFVHTGGTPVLFAMNDFLNKSITRRPSPFGE